LKEVEKYKVRSNSGGSLHVGFVAREEMEDVSDLADEENDPVNANKNVAWSERVVMTATLPIDSVVMGTIHRFSNGIHDGKDQIKEERYNRSNLVRRDVTSRSLTIPPERVSKSHLVRLGAFPKTTIRLGTN